ncbi:pyrroloquinoline quinone biosynthesis protein PqqB [bacterium]|nr:pyrroloquinoline quinone biosynthesis protein PqqB [bacterium]
MRLLLVLFLVTLSACTEPPASIQQGALASTAYLMVLGIGQDGGAPQAGSHLDPRWTDRDNAHDATSLGLVNPATGQRWMFEATPDFREQWYALDTQAGLREKRVPDGIFLTHAHIGHYTGLMFLGHESVGAQGVPVFTFPKMATFLSENGPWSQLVKYGNILLSPLREDEAVPLADNLSVTPFLVPHRQEFSEVAGYIINGPNKRVGFIPDIDSWEEWDSTGMGLDAFLNAVDLAYLDATFYADGEIAGRDMSGFPHPFLTHTMSRLSESSAQTKAKVVFIHLNHTNPALYPNSPEVQAIQNAGFRVATPGEIVDI